MIRLWSWFGPTLAFTEKGSDPIENRDQLHKNKEHRHPEGIEVLEKEKRILRILERNHDCRPSDDRDQRTVHNRTVRGTEVLAVPVAARINSTSGYCISPPK